MNHNELLPKSVRDVFVDRILVYYGFRSLIWRFNSIDDYKRSFDLADLMQLVELLVLYDHIYISKQAYVDLSSMLNEGKALAKWIDWADRYDEESARIVFNPVEKDDFKYQDESGKFIWKEFFINGIIKTWNYDWDELIISSEKHPGLNAAMKSLYISGNDHISSIETIAASYIRPDQMVRLSGTAQPYLSFIFPKDVHKRVLTSMEHVAETLSTAFNKEVSKILDGFELEKIIKVPFVFQLVSQRAKNIQHFPEAILEVRNEFKPLRDTITELENIVGDNIESLAKRLKAKKRLEDILEEASKDFSATNFWAITSWRDIVKDLWKLPKDMGDGLQLEDFSPKSIGEFILKYPTDIIISILKNRYLCNLPKIKTTSLSSPSFIHDFSKLDKRFSINVNRIEEYYNSATVNQLFADEFLKQDCLPKNWQI